MSHLTLQGFLFCCQMAGTVTGELMTPLLAHAVSYAAAFAALTAVALSALATLVMFERREVRLREVGGAGTASLRTTLLNS